MEFRRIFCDTLDDLPSLEAIRQELTQYGHFRIDYDINASFKSSDELKNYIKEIETELNVGICKGFFKELEFYNIYSLFSASELSGVAVKLEKAVKDYRLTSEKLISEYKLKYNTSFINLKEAALNLEHKNLLKDWDFNFHGGDICFSNSKTGQVVDINLQYEGYYGVLDLWFFQYFLETTKDFWSLSLLFKDNEPKLVQALNYLKKLGKVKTAPDNGWDSEKLIWNKEAREYQLVEPPIFEALDWDMDLIVACLEVIRLKLPKKFSDFPKGLEYDLLSVENPHGSAYPAIGIHASNKYDFQQIPDFHDLYDTVELWVNEMGIESIKQEAINISVLSWEELEKLRQYPSR